MVPLSEDDRPTLHLLVDGKPISFEQLKLALASHHADELLAGLCQDQVHRWRLGEPVRTEQYFAAFPILAYDPERMLALIYGEVMVRLQMGEDPSLYDYQKRFPELAE